MFCNHEKVWSVIDFKQWERTCLEKISKAYVLSVNEDINEIEKETHTSQLNDLFLNNMTTKGFPECLAVVTEFKGIEDNFNDVEALLFYNSNRNEHVTKECIITILKTITTNTEAFSISDIRDYKVREGELLLHTTYGCPWKKNNKED